jgi:hypothetical protein
MKIGREFHNNINSHNSFVFPLLFFSLKQDKNKTKKIKREQKTAEKKYEQDDKSTS